jgi:hypothetical protein
MAPAPPFAESSAALLCIEYRFRRTSVTLSEDRIPPAASGHCGPTYAPTEQKTFQDGRCRDADSRLHSCDVQVGPPAPTARSILANPLARRQNPQFASDHRGTEVNDQRPTDQRSLYIPIAPGSPAMLGPGMGPTSHQPYQNACCSNGLGWRDYRCVRSICGSS